MTTEQTILVIDDAPVNRWILEKILARQGFRVLSGATGRQGMDLCQRERPDLVLLDIMLPDTDGYTLCRQIKDDPVLDSIPVIFISSLNASEDILKGFEAGGVDYIPKPFQPAEVLARICTHLRLCSLQQDLEKQNQRLTEEKQKTENLLCHVLPARIARELTSTGRCRPRLFPETTVCFADIVGFTAAAAQMPPEELIRELNEIFTGFDRIMALQRCERIKTIGDAYLFACGVPEADEMHAVRAIRAAVDMLAFLEKRNSQTGRQWQIRVGMHSGPVVGGVVGTEKYLYDIFGDTVNVAARMEEMGQPMRINVSAASHALLQETFSFTEPRTAEVKGVGPQMMYILECT